MHLPPLTWLKAPLGHVGRLLGREREYQWAHHSNRQNHYFETLALVRDYRELMRHPGAPGREWIERRRRVRAEVATRLQGISTVGASADVLEAAGDLLRIYEDTHIRVLQSAAPTIAEREDFDEAAARFDDAIQADVGQGPR